MSAASGKTVKLLVAEDNPLVRDLVAKGLEPFCEVVIAADGADALLKVVDEPPDVILCDYNMPGLNGRQLFEKLRARESTRHIPFLFMASRTDIEERLRPLIEGAEDFSSRISSVRPRKWSIGSISRSCKSRPRARASFKAAWKK